MGGKGHYPRMIFQRYSGPQSILTTLLNDVILEKGLYNHNIYKLHMLVTCNKRII